MDITIKSRKFKHNNDYFKSFKEFETFINDHMYDSGCRVWEIDIKLGFSDPEDDLVKGLFIKTDTSYCSIKIEFKKFDILMENFDTAKEMIETVKKYVPEAFKYVVKEEKNEFT